MVQNSFRTPLARARGLGSAHDGVKHFIGERVTSIALAPLSLWAVYAGFRIAPAGYAGAVAFLASPINAVLAVLLIGVSAAHMELGMRVIIEDYVHATIGKVTSLLLNTMVCWTGGALAIFCILKVALTGAGVR